MNGKEIKMRNGIRNEKWEEKRKEWRIMREIHAQREGVTERERKKVRTRDE